MKFELKQVSGRADAVYKTIYIKRSLADSVEQIAKEHDTSFNNVVVSMIESCLKKE